MLCYVLSRNEEEREAKDKSPHRTIVTIGRLLNNGVRVKRAH